MGTTRHSSRVKRLLRSLVYTTRTVALRIYLTGTRITAATSRVHLMDPSLRASWSPTTLSSSSARVFVDLFKWWWRSVDSIPTDFNWIWSPQIRDPNGDGEQSGLQSSKYVFEDHALDNGLIKEKNKCYCRKGKGTLNIKELSIKFLNFFHPRGLLTLRPNRCHRLLLWISNCPQLSSFHGCGSRRFREDHWTHSESYWAPQLLPHSTSKIPLLLLFFLFNNFLIFFSGLRTPAQVLDEVSDQPATEGLVCDGKR